ncbi:MAG: S41 family peptidase, partial [Alistipes sp.]|nr:S41 family peptidase [Alistipes sp.]
MKREIKITLIFVMLSLLPCVVQAQRTDAAVVQLQKLNRLYRHLYNSYVDSVDMAPLVESGIRAMLEELDPHSVYLDEKEMKSSQEVMEGEFSGIGVEYNILNDTIMVVNTVPQGPAEGVGLLPNDRIVKIDGENVVGVERSDVPPRLRGETGTVVSVSVVRRGVSEELNFSITRDKIPITTVDAAYKISKDAGYIKVNRFGRTTMQEFEQAMSQLGDVGTLVLDLSNNGGGLLDQAVGMADYFIEQDSLVVSTEGRAIEPRYFYAKDGGRFKGNLIVMINESSASGSEIVAGAVQDWDRGLLVGRSSFGKGLVQSQIPLGDGTAVRLTVARYHTPSGRVIQRPYERGHADEYHKAHIERLRSADEDSAAMKSKFKTLRLGRDVYADGGIRPDIVVQSDTTQISDYMVKVVAKGVYNELMLGYLDRNREKLQSDYTTFERFEKEYSFPDEQ